MATPSEKLGDIFEIASFFVSLQFKNAMTMMTTNQEFKNAALAALRGNWAAAVLGTLVVAVIACPIVGASSLYELFNPDVFACGIPSYLYGINGTTALLYILVLIPLSVGFTYAFNALYVYSNPNVLSNSFGYGFKIYFRSIFGIVLVSIFTFLWSLLLLVPGIIKAYSYAMTPYILVDEPELSVREAIRRSQQMMTGQKFNLFWLQLSFIGWFFLSCVTGGIGFLWFAPYYQTSQAVFYQNLRNNF